MRQTELIEGLRGDKELWDLYTRKEEYSPKILDMHNRFPYYASRYPCIFEPRVSSYLFSRGFDIEYPDDRTFGICLTHDIDKISYSMLERSSRMIADIKRHDIKDYLRLAASVAYKRMSPLLNFEEIMDLEERYGARSTFYFMNLKRGQPDFRYDLDYLEEDLGKICDRGWEVGLHGSYDVLRDPGDLMKEKDGLEKILGGKVVGYRNHFLRFDVPRSWSMLKDAGFEYDSTLGYPQCAGFRNGMCHPFRPYDINSERFIDIIEIPLTIMDMTLFDYMTLDMKKAWDFTRLLIDSAEKVHGVVTILWHNTYMFNDNLKFYEKILRHGREKNAFMASGLDIAGVSRQCL